MPDLISARLSDEIPQPELSKMWESERTVFTTGTGDGIETWLEAPEMVIETSGKEVQLRFLSGPDREHTKMKAAFERAVHRYRPDVRIEWAA
jgi:hypothetical protein